MGPKFFGQLFKWELSDKLDLNKEESMGKSRPDVKRCKPNNHSMLLQPSSGKLWELVGLKEMNGITATPKNKTYKLIDFRTGMPTFMSTQVLHMEVGMHYKHHFMDDLESFWLLLWCVVKHRDNSPSKKGIGIDPTKKALKLLHQLDCADLELDAIANSKSMILTNCSYGDFEDDLKACGNSWATDPIIIDTIQELGTFFSTIHPHHSLSQYLPEDVFPKIVGVFAKALNPKNPMYPAPALQD
ncbi:unnamed protein product [Rhizoctonia solani]|uniref:Fungal-type protein kinase domain-containing protein n=1 Tax=Rhizoctonia solani TaxID=456999 RepID=A0A8H3BW64_9AGAM|nr:unnamed protein product [Rhizoctonia solani]